MAPRAGLNEKSILQAAAEIADTAGVDAVTLASLAAKLNVRSPSLYNHIGGLPDLQLRMAAYGFEQLYERLASSISSQPADCEKSILQLCFAYMAFAREHPGLYDSTQRPFDEDANQEASQKANEYGERIVDLCKDVLMPIGLPDHELIHAIRGFRSLLHGFAVLDKNRGFHIPLVLDDSLTFVIQAYMNGLRGLEKGGQ